MKQVQKILLRPYSIILGTLALLFLVSASLLPGTASAYQDRAQTLTPGAYACSTTFSTGPMAGQTERGTLVFKSDGTMSSSYPSVGVSGKGYWWVVDGQVNYSFRELLPPTSGATDVQPVHLITDFQNHGKSFTSEGRGLVYNSGVPLYTAQTTNQCILSRTSV